MLCVPRTSALSVWKPFSAPAIAQLDGVIRHLEGRDEKDAERWPRDQNHGSPSPRSRALKEEEERASDVPLVHEPIMFFFVRTGSKKKIGEMTRRTRTPKTSSGED